MDEAVGSSWVPKFQGKSKLALAGKPIRTAAPQGGTARRVPKPWQLPSHGLAVFHGSGDTARLSHYFLPRLLLQGERILFLDGANRADPRLMARLARERGIPFAQFNQQIQIARAFTCFQLTELIARVPQFLADFPAPVLVVTAFPDLYFDEDVRDWDARVAFEQALGNLRRWGRPGLPGPLSIAVFSSALDRPGPLPSARRRFFAQTCAEATEVWKFSLDEDHRLALTCTRV